MAGRAGRGRQPERPHRRDRRIDGRLRCADRAPLGLPGELSADGRFTWQEVECLGACANAPMVQINDDNYEDLTYDSMVSILEDLIAGRTPKVGSQIGRTASCPEGGATTLKEIA